MLIFDDIDSQEVILQLYSFFLPFLSECFVSFGDDDFIRLWEGEVGDIEGVISPILQR